MHLVKRSSACMWSYSSLTALPRRLLLWWASYTFMTTEEEQRIQGYSYNVVTNDQSQTINTGMCSAYCKPRWVACCVVCTCHMLPHCSADQASWWWHSPGHTAPIEQRRMLLSPCTLLQLHLILADLWGCAYVGNFWPEWLEHYDRNMSPPGGVK